ncbi:hypothetical protein EW146_g8781 [Bondarzewia mesenterica]|uniref:Vta1 C-terminal domain-containing protein n=1 Tax=Bondarzewia mesenterica TaxID=1095465 RepID=A0A4S4LBM3_9AGAM|nr:hypothetical protein EW146_g8781 [Bondarzewia mesenterica]
MALQSYLGLPPVPPDFKALTPFLQRADEVKSQDPIIAYWCAYYAAQVGINLKAPSHANRVFLSALLTALESLRATIGPSDAVDVESASTAYAENFALRVFTSADNEDRRGHAEKIRYSKWKAADIAKAFREGRQPTPGPAGEEPTETSAPSPTPPPSTTDLEHTPTPPQDGDIPRMSTPQAKAINQRYSTVRRSAEVEPPSSVDWSVQSTIGGDTAVSRESGVEDGNARVEGREDEGFYELSKRAAQFPPPPPPSPPSGEEPRPSSPPRSAPFTGRTSPSFSITSSGSGSPSRKTRISRTPPSTIPTTPPSTGSPGHRRSRTSSSASSAPVIPRPLSPTHYVPRNSPPPPPAPYPYPSRQYAPPPPQPAPTELAPSTIAKAQKHCRFAISALDYEDAVQARKELRAALAVLGE